jgi:hypothetical protein
MSVTNLMQVSSVEQDLVCSAGTAANLQSAYEQVQLPHAETALVSPGTVCV